MRYVFAAIILLYGVLLLVWPETMFRAMQGKFADSISDRYLRVSVGVLRVLGLLILVGIPIFFVLTDPAR